MVWSADGSTLWVSGGDDNTVLRYPFDNGFLGDPEEITVAEGRNQMVAGIAIDEETNTLYANLCIADKLVAVDLGSGEITEIASWPDETFPLALAMEPDGSGLWVSLWGTGAIERIDLANPSAPRVRVATGNHPNEILIAPDGSRLFVTCANDNTVHVFDMAEQRTIEILNTALHPDSPEGSTPNSLALSPDGEMLFVANADNNNVAVFDVEEPGHSFSEGFIPTGWYPTAVCLSADGEHLFVANGKGDQSLANPEGPNPYLPRLTTTEYIAHLNPGTLMHMRVPEEEDLGPLTRDAYECAPYRSDLTPVYVPEEPNPIPSEVGGDSPITHVIYIIKENRTYDQVLGDMPEGNGDPALCIFPEHVTPNHHALAREFVLLDNFYVESEVSADGHEWTTAAYATDFTERIWPINYGGYGFFYPAEGTHDAAIPDSGYIWDRCAEANVTYRSYGEFINQGETAEHPANARLESLQGHFDPWFRPYDLAYRDVDRTARFLEELQRFEEEGEMPQFMVVRLPNDHTSGTREGRPTPRAYLGDNDLALGRMIEGLSRSSFWPSMAIFVVEDDAQNGPDHVDAHRTVAFVVSPWTKRHIVDSHMYSTASMLRTMELILGLEPMSQFDAGARPMCASFTMQPDFTPYTAREANVDLEEINSPEAWGAALSATLNLEQEDQADDLLFNEIIWRSVRGAQSPMPPPVRAAFLRPVEDDDDD